MRLLGGNINSFLLCLLSFDGRHSLPKGRSYKAKGKKGIDMFTLNGQYYRCLEHFNKYEAQFLKQDIRLWQIYHNFYFNFTAEDFEDIQQELNLILIRKLQNKDKKYKGIYNYKNYAITIYKNNLFKLLNKLQTERRKKSKYEATAKEEFIEQKYDMVILDDIVISLEGLEYRKVKDLFKGTLTIKENKIVHLVHSNYKFSKIAKEEKISEDYVRKIYKRAEHKIRNALYNSAS